MGISYKQRWQERGVTLVELLVAMFILTIVLAMVTRTMTDGVATKDAISRDSKVSVGFDQVAEQLASDLRLTMNPVRSNATDLQLVSGVIEGKDLRDITVAGPYQLNLIADVVPASSGAECIRYQVDNQGSLWRVVTNDLVNCTAGVLGRERLLAGRRAPKTEPPISSNIVPHALSWDEEATMTFSYQLASTKDAVGNPIASGSPCRSVRVVNHEKNPALPPIEMRNGPDLAQILAVYIDMRPVDEGRSGMSARKGLSDSIAIRSRAGFAYRSAIGCARGVTPE